MVLYPKFIGGTIRQLQRVYHTVRSLYSDAPMVFAVVLTAILLVILITTLFSVLLSRMLGSRGTIAVDLALFWLFARLVARVLMFPGSLKLFQRNTEATFRIEMARQYVHYLRQLWMFLRHAAKQSDTALRGVTADGITKGCAVIENLIASFQMQQQDHEIQLNGEQMDMLDAAQGVDRWLRAARVQLPASLQRPSGGQQQPTSWLLVSWLRQQAAGIIGMPLSPANVLMSAELVGDREEMERSIQKVEHLLTILDDLRYQKKSMFGNAMRFFQVPTIGSLNQLRTELQMRYSGQHCWVRTRSGHQLDAMFIPYQVAEDDGQQACTEQEGLQEDSPLKPSAGKACAFSGPTLVWCNPNAAYYETMVYQTSWLHFWLSRGVNLFFFNYAGYGRSTGKPSPSRIADDGDSVIRYLKGKGIDQIAVYGRSIGGVAACHLARRHPDVITLLVADRTMSTLENAARFMYGAWAAKGLRLTAMIHDNVDNYWEVRCYKLLVCDPKDAMILDMAALRTSVALRVVEKMAAEERLCIPEDQLQKVFEVWRFFGVVFGICEGDDDAGFESGLGQDSGRPARQGQAREMDARSDVRLKVGDNGDRGRQSIGGGGELVTTAWLEENEALVRSTMSPMVDVVRSALDFVGENLEGGGVTLNDVFIDNQSNPCAALRCMLANLQVWGTLGDLREESMDLQHSAASGGMPSPPNPQSQIYGGNISEREIEHFLRKDCDGDFLLPKATKQRMADLSRHLTPEMIATYHRRLARTRVCTVRRELRRRLSVLQSSLAYAAASSAGTSSAGLGEAAAGELSERLLRTVLHHLGEVDSFVSALARFFKSVDLAVPATRQGHDPVAMDGGTAQSDSSDEKLLDAVNDRLEAASQPQPTIDHASAGYMMHIDCGHNGVLDEVDLRQMALHLRAARFGRTLPSE